MKLPFALGVVLVLLAYSGFPGAAARFAGVHPQISFNVDLASFYLGLITVAGATIRWLAKRGKSKEVI